MDIGPAELLIVLLIVLLIFGGAKLPSLARSIGEAAKEFRSGLAADSGGERSDDGAASHISTGDDDPTGEHGKD